MHRFITFACAVTAATLLVVGCGSDSDDSSSGGAGSGGSAGSSGSGGGSSSTECVGVYADLTRATFTSKVNTDGQCASDESTICSNDVTSKAESCGVSCLTMNATDMDGCVTTCLTGAVSPALSAGCVGCYVTDVGCARDNCKLKCISPTNPDCMTCRESNGCIAAFYGCSGLPVPGGSGPGAAGASGAGG